MDFKFYVPIKFSNSSKAYYFGTELENIKVNDIIVAESIRGLQVGQVTGEPIDITKYQSELELKPILRLATSDDLLIFDENKKRNVEALSIANEEIDKLRLDMRTIEAEYSLDGSKLTITYVADERVDFRDLLKVLAYKFKCRIELRQIGSRDKARLVGGLGTCGLELCCKRFLTDIDGISINRAKNQMLTLNIPKLSGACGKLICCLLYEDDAYTEIKKDFPNFSDKVTFEDIEYKVTAYNILSRSIKIEAEDGAVRYITLEDFNKATHKDEPKPQFNKNFHNNKRHFHFAKKK